MYFNSKKLSQDQIQALYSFTRQHYVEHYDLQTELVDHLANGIERQWQKTPELQFKSALTREFKKFGVGGFEKVMQKRKHAMEKRYFKIVLRLCRSYLKNTKLFFAALLVFALYSGLFYVPSAYRYDAIMGLLFAIVITVFTIAFMNRRVNELECVKHGRKWVLKDQIYNYGQYASFFNLFPIILNNHYFRALIPMDSSLVVFAFAALIVCFGLFSFIVIKIIPKKADELLAETYPEYKMVN